MKALNEKDVILSYMKFTVNLLILSVVTLFFIFLFLKTSEAELAEIHLKTGDSERIFRLQMELCDDIDDLFTRYKAFDVKEDVNTEFLMRSIVDRKMDLSRKVEKLPADDVKIHSLMLSKMEEFLRTRDSISAMEKEEHRVKEDLFMCNGDYKKLNKQKRTTQFFR